MKPGELQHDVAVFRAARIEQMKLLEQGAVLKRIRIDAELKREIARATETSRRGEARKRRMRPASRQRRRWVCPSRMAGSSTRTRSLNTPTAKGAPGA